MKRIVLAVAIVLAGARRTAQAQAAGSFAQFADEFVHRTLAFSPSKATQAGLHRYRPPGARDEVQLDRQLDDFSPAAQAAQRAYYQNVRARLRRIRPDTLDPQTRADYGVVDAAVSLALLTLDRERFPSWRPQLYPENLGTSLFLNISLDYADTATRAADLTARLEQAPAFLAQATRNLQASNAIYRRVALESVDGVVDLITNTAPPFVRHTPSADRYASAATRALAALESYKHFITDTLPHRTDRDWRIGRELYDAKWKYSLQVAESPEVSLRAAEDSMAAARLDMLRLSRPLHEAWFPDHRHTGPDTLNAIVGEVLARIGAEHVDRDSMLAEAVRQVADLESYVRDHRILSLTDFSNLEVIPTPPFMRGIYGVAGAVFAPALEPKLATFYWVTPIPASWPADQAEAKLREYNAFKMLTITIHEAVPGHAVQGEYANRVEPEWRRLLRAIYNNTPYVEGWAVYAEHMMRASGVDGGDSVKARLTELKGMLRIYANAIIDVRLHTMGMSEHDAVDLMMTQAFQERPEAEAKLQRAQLDYAQLPAYFLGERAWVGLRRDAERAEGGEFNQCRYHDTVLLYGPLPLPEIRSLYLAHVPPTASAPSSRCSPDIH